MVSFILLLHQYNVYLVLGVALVTGIWGLILFFRKQNMVKPWRNALIVTTALGLLQGLLGVIMVLLGLKPGGGGGPYYLHYVYGGIVALGIPIAYVSFTDTSNEKNVRRNILIFSIAVLIMVAAGIRAWMTGAG